MPFLPHNVYDYVVTRLSILHFQIFSTAVHEDGHELSLTVSFALRGTNDPFTGEKLGYSDRDFLSSYTEGRKSNLQRFPSEDSLGVWNKGNKVQMPFL